MPVTQYDGVTLVRQNVAMKCKSEHPDLIEAQAEVSEMEGYFCSIKFVGRNSDYSKIPSTSKIIVSVSSNLKSKGQKKELYR